MDSGSAAGCLDCPMRKQHDVLTAQVIANVCASFQNACMTLGTLALTVVVQFSNFSDAPLSILEAAQAEVVAMFREIDAAFEWAPSSERDVGGPGSRRTNVDHALVGQREGLRHVASVTAVSRRVFLQRSAAAGGGLLLRGFVRCGGAARRARH